jgi:acyl-CoA thioesterase
VLSLSFDEILERAGSFKNLFAASKRAGLGVEAAVQKAMAMDSELFRTIGYEVVKVGGGRAELRFPFSKEVARRGGMVHGGISMYSLDNACGIAVMTINPGVDQVTIELKVNFLEPLSKGPFTVRGKVIRAGGKVATAEGEVKDADGTLCAKSLGTWYMIKKDASRA